MADAQLLLACQGGGLHDMTLPFQPDDLQFLQCKSAAQKRYMWVMTINPNNAAPAVHDVYLTSRAMQR